MVLFMPLVQKEWGKEKMKEIFLPYQFKGKTQPVGPLFQFLCTKNDTKILSGIITSQLNMFMWFDRVYENSCVFSNSSEPNLKVDRIPLFSNPLFCTCIHVVFLCFFYSCISRTLWIKGALMFFLFLCFWNPANQRGPKTWLHHGKVIQMFIQWQHAKTLFHSYRAQRLTYSCLLRHFVFVFWRCGFTIP